MTRPDDEQPEPGRPDGDHELDEAAAWADIVANYGDEPVDPDSPVVEPVETRPVVETNLFDRAFVDSQDAVVEPWDAEEHFVPPEPPPLPKLEPRRKLAWIGLFGAPLLMLIAVVAGLTFPDWFIALMVAAFIGGFIYLVATMSRRGSDDWPGDDGAVV
jgi:hypothetical protein